MSRVGQNGLRPGAELSAATPFPSTRLHPIFKRALRGAEKRLKEHPRGFRGPTPFDDGHELLLRGLPIADTERAHVVGSRASGLVAGPPGPPPHQATLWCPASAVPGRVGDQRRRLTGRATAQELFIGSLSFARSSERLHEFLADLTGVESVKVITDQFRGRSHGFASVEMATSTAEAALEKFNGQELDGRRLTVEKAKLPGPGGDCGGGDGHRSGGRGRW
jgi:RNA recognition motif